MLKTLAVAAALACLMGGTAAAKDAPPLQTAKAMVAAWNALDIDRIMALFTDDAVLHSVMVEPVKGQAEIREHLAALLKGATRLELRVKHEAVTGNTVFLERVDDFDFRGKHGAVPVVGVMEIEHGKVKVWREYYDRATLLREMGLAPAP